MPRPVANEPRAFEIARIWGVSGGGQHLSLSTNVVADPSSWGILLVNLAKHVASAYQQTKGLDAEQTLKGIKAAFDAEWNEPTDRPRGAVVRPEGDNPK
jgi:Domain of unknown function (DUF5076)